MSVSVENIKLYGKSGNEFRPSHIRMTLEEFDYLIECSERYQELLYQVEEKVPDQTRFETAKSRISHKCCSTQCECSDG